MIINRNIYQPIQIPNMYRNFFINIFQFCVVEKENKFLIGLKRLFFLVEKSKDIYFVEKILEKWVKACGKPIITVRLNLDIVTESARKLYCNWGNWSRKKKRKL